MPQTGLSTGKRCWDVLVKAQNEILHHPDYETIRQPSYHSSVNGELLPENFSDSEH